MQNRLDWIGFGRMLPLMLAAVACSSPSTAQMGADSAVAPSTKPIGAEGGMVAQNGATLVIPVGALSSDTVFTIAADSAPPLSGVSSRGFVFAPDVTFAKPVTITIPMEVASPDAHLYWIPPTNGLMDLGGVVSGLSITAQVSRLGGLAFACTPNHGNMPNCAL